MKPLMLNPYQFSQMPLEYNTLNTESIIVCVSAEELHFMTVIRIFFGFVHEERKVERQHTLDANEKWY